MNEMGETMRRRSCAAILSICLILAFFVIGNTAVLAEQVQAKVYHYVALGDSLTAGFEPWMTAEWESKRSFPTAYGFVERVYEQALYNGRAEVKNYGILGLKSEGLSKLLSAVSAGSVVQPDDIQPNLPDPRIDEILAKAEEMKSSIQAADLITITIGGNDFMDFAAWMEGKTEQEIEAELEKRLNLYAENLTHSLQTMLKLNPNAKIVIADQYQPYPKLGNQDLYAKLEKYSQALTAKLENVTASMNLMKGQLGIAYVAKRFVSYEAAFTYMNMLEPEKSDIHPNQKGYAEMAKAFAETIWGGYKEVSNKHPIGIVVKGKELKTPYQPILEAGTTYVPVREYVEALGGHVEWDQASQSAIANFKGIIVKYTAASDIIEVNGKEVKMSAPVKLVRVDQNDRNGKTYVPLRALAEEGLKLDVQYIQESNTAYINP